jgi:uncharacterized membrane protein
MKNLIIHKLSNFITCGAFGWCLECFWTGLGSIFNKNDKRLFCRTSVWMFPIYSMAAFIEPISRLLKGKSVFFRGSVYTICIYIMEFFTGAILKKHHACPWDYSRVKTNIKGLIRLDFAPLWFFTGLAYERLLTLSENRPHS